MRWSDLAAAVLLVSACSTPRAHPAPAAPERPFYLGADISYLDAADRFRNRFPAYQENGTPSDELTILKNHGWNAFRLRVFVSPVRQAPDNSLEHTIPLARRIKESGAVFLLDIHYSDTWADPQHQEIPVAWRGLSFDSLERQVEVYSRETIKALKDAGAMPDWVQVGNEITRGTLWPLGQLAIPGNNQYLPPQPYDSVAQWDHLTRILKAGIRGVMEAPATRRRRSRSTSTAAGTGRPRSGSSTISRRRTSRTTSSPRASTRSGATARSTSCG